MFKHNSNNCLSVFENFVELALKGLITFIVLLILWQRNYLSFLHRCLFLQFLDMCAYQWVRNGRFFGKFGVLCFPVTSVLSLDFLPYYRRND